MLSDTRGLSPRRTWFPRVVDEAFLTSTKDGTIQRAPDPVTMIDGDIAWTNETGDDQQVSVHILRSSRGIVVSNPSTVILIDAWSWDIGVNPQADFPSVTSDAVGGGLQIDRASVAPDSLQFAQVFIDGDNTQAYADVGVVPDGQVLHFRYMCSVQTPGVWTESTDWTPRFEANARYARLSVVAAPVAA